VTEAAVGEETLMARDVAFVCYIYKTRPRDGARSIRNGHSPSHESGYDRFLGGRT